MQNETVALLMERPVLLVAMVMQEMGVKLSELVVLPTVMEMDRSAASHLMAVILTRSDAIGSLCFNTP